MLFVTTLITGASLQAFIVPLFINAGEPIGNIAIFGLPTRIGNLNELMISSGYNRAYVVREYSMQQPLI